MYITFQHIHAENFLSYENIDVDLTRSGYTMVSGVNENPDDASASNGSGKSSLWEALTWCITGDTIRGTKDVKRYNSEGTCLVTLDILIDNIPYKITRTKEPSNLYIYINGEDKSGKGIRDTEKLLSEYLPDLNAQLLGSVIILGQGLPQRFTNNSPAGRKEVLEKLSKSDFMISDLKDRIAGRKSSLSNSIRENEDSKLKTETNLHNAEQQKSILESNLSNLVLPSTDEIEAIKNRIVELNSHKELKNSSISSLTAEMDSIQSELNSINKKMYDSIDEKKESYKNIIDELNKKSFELNSKVNSLNQEIRRLDSITDVCPTCGQKIPGTVKPDTTAQKEEVASLKNLITENSKKISDVNNDMNNEISVIKDLSTKESSDLSNRISAIKKDITAVNMDISILDKEILSASTSVTKMETDLKRYNELKDKYESDIKLSEESIAKMNSDLLYICDERTKLQQHLDAISKMETLISRDFRGHLLTNVINFIDKRAKDYSEKVFGTDKISFNLNGNNIDISYCGKEYVNLSGGEQQKINLIIQFAIRDMLCTYLNFSSNILVLDEITDNLDSTGCDNIMELISSKLNDVESIYIISHHKDLQLPCDNEIIFIKGEDGVSRLKV